MSDTLITSIEQVQVGDFVRFVDRDKSGKFSYTGEVTNVYIPKKSKKTEKKSTDVDEDPAKFEMLTFDGTMGFTFPTGKEVEHELHKSSTKPTGWSKFKKNPVKVRQEKVEAAQVKPVTTKKEQVAQLVANHPRMGFDGLLKKAAKDIGGSTGQLSAYINLALAKK
jgi:hypothetical protein